MSFTINGVSVKIPGSPVAGGGEKPQTNIINHAGILDFNGQEACQSPG